MKKIYTILFIIICSTTAVFSQTWDSLASGLGDSGQVVKAIVVDGSGDIYAGGTFTGAVNYFAKWNSINNAWESVGVFDGPVYAISTTATEMYVGGSFTTAGGVAVHNIAKFDGTSWTDVGGGFNGIVRCVLAENGGTVYAGGEFSLAGINTMNHISKLVAGNWTQLGSGIGSIVNSIVVNNTIIYTGTEDVANPVKQFDGFSWTSVTGLTSGKVFTLAIYNGELFAGGDFQQPVFAGARYNSGNWGTMSTTFAFGDKIFCMYVRAGILYVGGKYVNKGIPNLQASYAAYKKTSNDPIQTITATANQLNDEVYAISTKGNSVIAGGKFTTQNHIAIANTTIGIDEISSILKEKNFFPNPVTDKAKLVVSTSIKMKKPELQIFDIQNKILSEIKVSQTSHQNEVEFSFDCSSLPKGNYYYVLTEEGKNVTSDQFIVE